jgi:endo-1,4-beta-mannosidase
MLRGTNYLPQSHPWVGLWRETTAAEMDADAVRMEALGMNAFRTFLFFDEEANLVDRDGTMHPEVTAKIDALLQAADAHHLKVILCVGGSVPHRDEPATTWRRFVRTAVEPFANDGRVLAWDLVNEPGGDQGPASPDWSTFVQTTYAELVAAAPRHLRTVGVAWQLDQLATLGVRPELAQYHEYSGAVAVQPPGAPPVRNIADDARQKMNLVGAQTPLIFGEFGYSTQPADGHTDASEARQREIYANVLSGAEAAQVAGVFNWTLYHFEPTWMGTFEQAFGIVRLDGTLKPAGELLVERYRTWRTQRRAPWEVAE